MSSPVWRRVGDRFLYLATVIDTRLYALALTRIVEFTAGDLHRHADNAYLTISRPPVILPPSPAHLIEEQIAATAPQHLPADPNSYLLPGRRPGRARNLAGLADSMRRERDLVRDPGLLTPPAVVGPGLRQVDPAVDQASLCVLA